MQLLMMSVLRGRSASTGDAPLVGIEYNEMPMEKFEATVIPVKGEELELGMGLLKNSGGKWSRSIGGKYSAVRRQRRATKFNT